MEQIILDWRGSRGKIRRGYGLKTPDAIFVATAFEEGAQAFITNDIKLNRVEGIKMIILDEFV